MEMLSGMSQTCRDKGPTIITDERKDRQGWSLNECTVNIKDFLLLLQVIIFLEMN